MRNFTFILLFFSAALLVSCGPTVKDAIKYSDNIETQNELVIGKLEELIDSYDEYIPEEMDNAYAAANTQVNESLDYINKMQPFGEDSTFKAGAQQLFKTYKSILDVEHKKIISLLKLPADKYGDEEIAEYAKLIETANQKADSELNRLIQVQESFAKKYKFDLVKEE
jgi:hypothetical protein